MSLEPDYTLDDVALALGMSEKWVRRQVQTGAPHQRYGNKIRFTPEQVEALRARFASGPATEVVTARRRRSA